MPVDFHEVRFPLAVALGGQGGPERLTEIVTLGSGRERRNARWAQARRRYDAGYGVKSLDALHEVIAFFEERRGRLYGFRWRDRSDWKSCPPLQVQRSSDQPLGTDDGVRAGFQLIKRYGGAHAPCDRPIRKPVAGSVRIAVDGVEMIDGLDVAIDAATGVATFVAGRVPAPGASITAGFEFDTPVRFAEDSLTIDFSAFDAGVIPKIPLIEIII